MMFDGRTLVLHVMKTILWRLFVIVVSVGAFVAIAIAVTR